MSETSNYMFDGKIDLRQVKKFDFLDRAKTLWQGIKFVYKSKTYDGNTINDEGAVICSGATASQPIFTKWQFVPNAAFAEAVAAQYGEDLSGFSGGTLLDVLYAVRSAADQMGEFPSGWEEFAAWLGGNELAKAEIRTMLNALADNGDSIECRGAILMLSSETSDSITYALGEGTVSGVLNELLNIQAVGEFLRNISFDDCMTQSGTFSPQMQFGSALTLSIGSSLSRTEVIQQ